MYKPSLYYKRTPEEKADKFLAWERDDISFFAAGACHILAFMFMELHSHENKYNIIGIKTRDDSYVHHVYVTDGIWAFDYAGWTLEEEILEQTKKVNLEINPIWDYEKIIIDKDLETFCKEQYHRPPSYFPYLPWERAYKFIKMHASSPPLN